MGPDNFARVLLNHPADGQMSLWRVDPSSPTAFNPVNYGPYSGYTALSVAVGGNNAPRILWNHAPDNLMSLWNITSDISYTFANYGPYAGYNFGTRINHARQAIIGSLFQEDKDEN